MNSWGLRTGRARDPGEAGRTAVPLELFFDLVFVVAVSLVSQYLHHFETEAHFSTGLARYLMMFFAIWWAWMNFTWFASGYATNDWLYRLLSLVQMAGALVMAAGVPAVMEDADFSVAIGGYVIMRFAMVLQWLRVARDDPDHRSLARRYAFGIAGVQVLWVGFSWIPEGMTLPAFVFVAALELLVPVYATRTGVDAWHPHHIGERYGLFTLIVLGESVLAASTSIIEAYEEASHYGDLILLAATAFVIVCGMWWIYFEYPQSLMLGSLRRAFLWGYGHYFIFAAAAAYSAGIEVALDYETHETGLAASRAAATVCVPVAVFLAVTWFLTIRRHASRTVNLAMPLISGGVLVAIFPPWSLQVAAVLVVALVVLLVIDGIGRSHAGSEHGH
jgi:low temperature requirement protein LtrA